MRAKICELICWKGFNFFKLDWSKSLDSWGFLQAINWIKFFLRKSPTSCNENPWGYPRFDCFVNQACTCTIVKPCLQKSMPHTRRGSDIAVINLPAFDCAMNKLCSIRLYTGQVYTVPAQSQLTVRPWRMVFVNTPPRRVKSQFLWIYCMSLFYGALCYGDILNVFIFSWVL